MRKCNFKGCGRKIRAKGLCVAHYRQMSLGQELKPIIGKGNVGHKHTQETKDKIGKANSRKQSLQHKINMSNSKWKGGMWKTKYGYVRYRPQRGNRIPYHRYIMEQHLGRKLKLQETVHHINGKRDDNRLDNLFLFETKSDHQKYHAFNKLIFEEDK